MILRRVVQHFRHQEWTAIAIDFLIVVAGVFVGLQVSNWNADRIQHSQEREFLIRLHEDFEQSVAGQRRDLAFLDQQLSDQAVILKSLEACAVAPDDSEAFQRGINTLGFINPPRLYRRTIDEMAAAGETGIIRNEAIKTRLDEIVALVEWRANGFDQVSRMTEHHRYIIEEQVKFDLTRTYSDPFLGDFVGVDFDIEALCHQQVTASAISAISNTTRERQRAYAPILHQYTEFLPMLQSELQARWNVAAASETAAP